MEQIDVLIIGGGPAGYVAAIRAAQLKARVIIVENDTMGGTCLNRGCMPTRSLVRAVELLEQGKKASDYGINFGKPEINFAKMMTRKGVVVKTLVSGVEMLVKGNGAEMIKGKATLLSPSAVEVQIAGGNNRQITAKSIILATGAHTIVPSIPGKEILITTDQALQFQDIPRSLLILGGGPIGFAFAAIFSRLGTSVTVAEKSAQILTGVDKEITAIFEKELKRDKISVLTKAEIQSIREGESGDKNITLSVNGQETTISAQFAMLADERKPSTDGLALDKTGVKLNNGAIAVDKKMCTSVPGIYAAGDVTGGPMFAHVAFAQGKLAAENALGIASDFDYSVIPLCVNSIPEIGSVGMTEDEAKAKGHQLKIGRFPFAANGMATILGERNGTIKIISDSKYGQILGIHIIGPQATTLIAEAALAMKMDATPKEIGYTIHAHPTVTEALMEAALDVTGETLHFMSANK
jgi:dihydrolipoamide dehydrogenase